MNEENQKKHTTIKIWPETLKSLRMIHAETGDAILKIVDRLASQELEKIRSEKCLNVENR